MVSNNSSLQAISLMSMPRVATTGRAYVPVKPSQVIYAHFSHVSGVKPENGQSGVSIDKLRILNSIIDQLVSMKTNDAQKAEFSKTISSELDSKLSAEQLDVNIEYYQAELQNAVAQTESIGYGGPAPAIASVLTMTA